MVVMNIITKLVAIIVVIVLVMVGIFYSLGVQKDASAMDVSVYVYVDDNGNAQIVHINGSLREVNKVSMPKGNDVETPGVIVNVINKGDFIGYWTSVKLDPNAPLNSTTSYNLTVGLFENPERGDNVNISARIVGFTGGEMDSAKTKISIP